MTLQTFLRDTVTGSVGGAVALLLNGAFTPALWWIGGAVAAAIGHLYLHMRAARP